ncbi:MAG: HDOD domain-containing protein [Deltaproteobacteria bacterium]|nr:HDOD domain-containing protein [Deltaproteobacteria bacterium]MBW2480916.1 HDOD domain-containing protein [Deltaproteobacteria bacterium]
MNEDKIKRIMAQVKSFPGMPVTAAKLLKMLDNPDSTAAEIEEILRYDAGLTANILKLTNSAYFGIPSKVSSVRQAIMMLGWKRLLQLVMTMCMSTVMKKPIVGYDLPQGALWRHSVAVSVAAEAVVKALKIPEAEEVFTAALLHDVGKLVLGGFVKNDMDQIKAMVAKGIAFEVAEYMVIGTDHAEIGANILKKWDFPQDLVNAVNWHHDPETCENHCTLSDIVHIANTVGLRIGFGRDTEGARIEPSPSVTDRLGLEPVDIEVLVEQTFEGVNKLSDELMVG